MGQVLTCDALLERRVPKAEDFATVMWQLRSTLAKEGSIALALLYGSVPRGDSNCRSDVDCLVVYDREQEARALEVMRELDKAAHALSVPINAAPADTVVARTRLHAFGESFRLHLKVSAEDGGLIKGNLESLLVPTLPMKLEIESYISKKMYTLQEAATKTETMSCERKAAVLKKMLEAPMHVARKMLVYEGTLGGDSKRDVQTRYRETMPRALSEALNHLVTVDAWYTRELERQLERPDTEEYIWILGALESELPSAIDFLRLNIVRLDEAR